MIFKKNRLVVIVSLLIVTGFLITIFASYYVSRTSLRSQIRLNELPLTSDNVYSEIQRDMIRAVFISSMMASNTFLRDWVIEGEQDETRIIRYLKEIQNRYATSTSFFVSEYSRMYYQTDGILKTVSPSEERDKWYFRVRKMDTDYEINVDPDMANKDVMSIFVNYRVYDDAGNFIGVTGVGLQISTVKKIIEDYQQRYNSNIYFIDTKGDIVLHGLHFPFKADNIHQIKGIASLAGQIILQKKGSFQYENQGRTYQLHVRYLPEFKWYLLVDQDEEKSVSHISKALFLNLLIGFIITLIILLLTRKAISSYQSRIETLKGIVPICSSCKKIRDDKGFWNQVEVYVSKHTEAEFTHGICPDCTKKLYPDLFDQGDV